MNQAGITVHDRPVVDVALSRAEETEAPAAALELADGRMITGKTTLRSTPFKCTQRACWYSTQSASHLACSN